MNAFTEMHSVFIRRFCFNWIQVQRLTGPIKHFYRLSWEADENVLGCVNTGLLEKSIMSSSSLDSYQEIQCHLNWISYRDDPTSKPHSQYRLPVFYSLVQVFCCRVINLNRRFPSAVEFRAVAGRGNLKSEN